MYHSAAPIVNLKLNLLTFAAGLVIVCMEVSAVWIVTRLKIGKDRPFFSVGPMELFEKIEQYASIKKATEAMEMSYTKALRIIRVAEEELGFPMVLSEKGGSSRGATRLTARAKAVLTAFQELYADVSAYAEQRMAEKFKF